MSYQSVEDQQKKAMGLTLALPQGSSILWVRPVKYEICIEEVTTPGGNTRTYSRILEIS